MNAVSTKNKKRNDNVALISSVLCANLIKNMSPECSILFHKRYHVPWQYWEVSKYILLLSPILVLFLFCCHKHVTLW